MGRAGRTLYLTAEDASSLMTRILNQYEQYVPGPSPMSWCTRPRVSPVIGPEDHDLTARSYAR